jgi:hypothetical protein
VTAAQVKISSPRPKAGSSIARYKRRKKSRIGERSSSVSEIFRGILHGNIAFGVKVVKKTLIRSQAILKTLLE